MESKQKLIKVVFIFALFLSLIGNIGFLKAAASSYDKIAPTIGSAKVIENEIYAPAIFQIELYNIVEEGSGIDAIIVTLDGFDSNFNSIDSISHYESINNESTFSTNKYTLSIPVSTEVETGNYYVNTIAIRDNKGNQNIYRLSKTLSSQSERVLSCSNGEFTISNAKINIYGDEFDVSTSISNPNLATILKNMDDGETANVYSTSSSATTVPKAAFDAIKGTNKKMMVSVSDGVKWVFNGKDITNTTKAVNCKVTISTVSNESYGTTSKLMQATFASNGTLPGKATIKLKSDYLSSLYNLDNDLYLYYLDNQKLTLEDKDVTTIKDSKSTWAEITIDHNSKFLFSQKKLSYKKAYVKLNASSINMQVKQTSTALKIKSKLSTDTVKKWTSSKPSVVAVNKKTGKLKAKKTGKSTIKVTLNSGVTAKCTVKVQKAKVKTKTLTLALKKITLKKKETYKISYTRKPITANDGKITFKSNKPKIVSVNKNGKVTAKKKGTAKITVKAGSKTKKLTVTVK